MDSFDFGEVGKLHILIDGVGEGSNNIDGGVRHCFEWSACSLALVVMNIKFQIPDIVGYLDGDI